MPVNEEARYRLRLAEGFLDEARQDLASRRWRSCVDGSQLAAENSAKAVLALIGPVGKSHEPAVVLRLALEEERYEKALEEMVRRLAELAEQLGRDIHVETDYGEESAWKTPWELFGESDAQKAFSLAEEAVGLTKKLFEKVAPLR